MSIISTSTTEIDDAGDRGQNEIDSARAAKRERKKEQMRAWYDKVGREKRRAAGEATGSQRKRVRFNTDATPATSNATPTNFLVPNVSNDAKAPEFLHEPEMIDIDDNFSYNDYWTPDQIDCIRDLIWEEIQTDKKQNSEQQQNSKYTPDLVTTAIMGLGAFGLGRRVLENKDLVKEKVSFEKARTNYECIASAITGGFRGASTATTECIATESRRIRERISFESGNLRATIRRLLIRCAITIILLNCLLNAVLIKLMV